MPNKNNPSRGPYVYPATIKITLIIDLSFNHLKIIIHKKKIIANVTCTIILVFFVCFSVTDVLRLKPKISMQKDEVSAVKAPSALGNKADISPIIKMIATNNGK